MFRAVLPQPKLFRLSIETIAEIISEGVFRITPDEGIKFVALDPSKIAMVILNMRPTAFSEYEVDEELKIGVNFSQLKPIIKRVKARDTLELSMDEEKNQLVLTIAGSYKRTFYVPILDIPESEVPTPNLTFNVKAEVDADILKDAVKDAKIFSDALIFEADENKFTIKAEGELSKVVIELTRDSPALINLEVKEPSRAAYSLDYLKKFAKASDIADILQISFSSNYPAELTFRALEKLDLSFILAPREE